MIGHPYFVSRTRNEYLFLLTITIFTNYSLLEEKMSYLVLKRIIKNSVKKKKLTKYPYTGCQSREIVAHCTQTA